MTRVASALFGLLVVLLLVLALPASAQQLGGIYREQGVNPNGSRYIGMAAIVPDGDAVNVTWWIGRDVFKGVGRVDGDKLVEMLEQLELGLRPKKTFEVDASFFKDFEE